MRKSLAALLLIAAAFTIQACAPKSQNDCGFLQNVYGERISWKKDLPVKMYLDESVPDQYVESILAAAQTWERQAGRRVFDIQTQKIRGGAPTQNNQNVIYWLNGWEENRRSEQGRTSVYWVGDQIKEADIRINASKASNFSFYTTANQTANFAAGINIEALMLHELGHVIGLKHKDESGSVMGTYLANGANRTALAAVDQTDLKCEY